MTRDEVDERSGSGLRTAGFFAGVGGFELGFEQAGFETSLLCENDEYATHILEERFPAVSLHTDIATMSALPRVDAVLAGFPCQDLSAVGRRVGIGGERSALVGKLFDLIEGAAVRPDWIVLENVPFMLQLQRGAAMAYVIDGLEALGYRWAYRVVDSRAFALPQRRRRVFVVATRTNVDPANVLFADDAAALETASSPDLAKGFYWTEGNTGLGWAIDAIPTLKGGSSWSIPSPPAIWMPDGGIRVPDIRDAERLQGLIPDWTEPQPDRPSMHGRRRWRQVGNAVSVPLAAWVAKRIVSPGDADRSHLSPLDGAGKWPFAATGRQGERHAMAIGEWPFRPEPSHLHRFLAYDTKALSKRAAAGFYKRILASTLRVEPGFLDAMADAAEEPKPSVSDLAARLARSRAKVTDRSPRLL